MKRNRKQVAKPGNCRPDYLSMETGSCRKKWKDKLPLALIFPNHYRVGMSNLGLQTIYHLLNSYDDIVCERVFLPEDDGQPLSVESGRPLADFPFLLISASFEEDFGHIVEILLRSGIEPLAAKRTADQISPGSNPLIIAGGVVTFINPEPIAPFVDLFLIGEAELSLAGIIEYLADNFTKLEKAELLFKLGAEEPGCYAPRFYTPVYDDGRLAEVKVATGLPARIKKIVVPTVKTAGHSRILTPETEFSDLYLTELGRGCSRSCRFCAAGFVNRPPRLWSPEAIISALAERGSEVERVGLLGMEMAGQDSLKKVAEFLLQQNCSLSFSSLRADALSDTLIDLLAESKLKTAAIAPDGASERLRRVINKGIVEEDVLAAAEMLVGAGVSNLKLYFMIGLPTETMADIEEMVDLVHKVKEKILPIGRKRGWLSNISLSVNSFVPKAWTPFQFHPFADPAELKKRIKFLRKQLGRQANIKLMADQPGNALFQAMLARGDRRTGAALVPLAKNGGNWQQVFKEAGISKENVLRYRSRDELFPWDIIDHGIKRDYLWAEYQRALAEKISPACDTAKCRRCGVC